MIQPQELRIGNIVCPINKSSEIHMPMTLARLEVLGISETKVEVIPLSTNKLAIDSNKTLKLSDITGIPLRIGWLYDNADIMRMYTDWNWEHYKVGLISIQYETRDRQIYIWGFESRIGIKYVHQFQNIYFALTGEDLRLKQHIIFRQ